MKILVTGGAGFIGSHVAEHYAKQGHDVVVFDNLSRADLLNKKEIDQIYSWNFLKQFKNISLVKGDVRNIDELKKANKGVDVVFHAAAQTAVTSSIEKPEVDFTSNALGTFNVLESVRAEDVKSFIYCSTNKVYGENVNKIGIKEGNLKYSFDDKRKKGVSENFSIDNCEHTPYGCSKLAGDIYTQDYAHLYGLKAGIFRMSCIYGTRQFGLEDQGWVAWFTIATILGKPITIYGDGKQVRDVLYISDLIEVYDKFLKSNLNYGVFNIGGGPKNTLSLLELLNILKKATGKESKITFDDWRPSDQKVFISNIDLVREKLGWEPKIGPEEGVKRLVGFVKDNVNIF